jgi:hypothetical protein
MKMFVYITKNDIVGIQYTETISISRLHTTFYVKKCYLLYSQLLV